MTPDDRTPDPTPRHAPGPTPDPSAGGPTPVGDLFVDHPPAEHGPGFWDAVDRRLADERPGAGAPDVVAAAPAASTAASRSDRDGDEHIVELGAARRVAPRRWPLALAAAAVVAVVALVATSIGGDADGRLDTLDDGVDQAPADPDGGPDRDPDPNPQPTTPPNETGPENTTATATEGVDGVTAAITVTWHDVPQGDEPTRLTGTFAAAVDGSVQLALETEGWEQAHGYDASTATTWSTEAGSEGDTASAVAGAGLLSAIDHVNAYRWRRGFVASEPSDAGDRIEVDGRPTVRFETDLEPNQIGGGPDHLVTLVDAATGIVVRSEESVDGEPWLTVELHDLDWAALLDRAVFGPPAGTDVEDGALRTVDGVPADLEGQVPLPTVLPGGYELVRTQVAAGPDLLLSGSEAGNPAMFPAVVSTYRRGWDELRVTTFAYEDAGFGFADPLGGEGLVAEETDVSLGGDGFFTGVDANLVTAPGADDHLWGVDGTHGFLVAGDATVDDLVAVAEGLRTTG